ncbi:aldo/keto reductase, diketogulonate reductase [Halovivax ruber XH-70]|uniref:Aldo/keto reductase, diketogulonate reductase n=1 Tax=Halovivax ruber (strain DSM 18193 / JCM 13892 / XH-70) TaxID=797302 RepID=L0IAU4_HALRX|nr:aldo/keto reductase [Halovivax ruber]AGB15082.1 aldo/keto reductase, diketogulonate reductase [Halovivax ruber XH-70]
MSERTIPLIGFGTYRLEDHDQCAALVSEALEAGYRHVDTASAYNNEAAVGEGVRTASVPREDVVVATKVWYDRLDYGDLKRSVEVSLDRMGLSTLDLVYVHWPVSTYDPPRTFAALDMLFEDGLIDGIGVANFTIEQLESAREYCEAGIDVLQIECHPLLPQWELCEYAYSRDIDIVAHTPLLQGELEDVPELRELSADRNCSPVQVGLAWLQSRGISAIPGTSDLTHLVENFESPSIELTEDEQATIDGIERRRRIADPYFAPW